MTVVAATLQLKSSPAQIVNTWINRLRRKYFRFRFRKKWKWT